MTPDFYLDSNATTTVLPAAADAVMRTLVDTYGNPSSAHSTGLRARAVLDEVRERAGRLLGVGDGRLVFNSGATEGIQTAVLSALCAIRERRASGLPTGSLLLYGATEHKAVPESLAHWNRVLGLDFELRSIPVDKDGRHHLAALASLVPDAAMVCTMAANNETGTISDIDGIGALLANSPALWLVDCVQALGKLPVDLARTRIDYAPFSGHKLYAPKGVGMLYVRASAPFTPLMMGGGQENGLRSGTENLPGIAALGAVLAALESGGMFRSQDELAELRKLVVAALSYGFPGIVFNTPLDKSLATTLNFSVPGLGSGQLLDVFDAAGIRVSAGSACSAAKGNASYVLDAMGLPAWRCENAVRLSFGPATELPLITAACRQIIRCADVLRENGMLAGGSAGRLDGARLVGSGGLHAWLLFDAESGRALAVDLPPALRQQVDVLLQRHGHALAAELSTADGTAWPENGDSMVLGRWRLRRVPAPGGAACFVVEGKDGVAVLAFTGALRAGELEEVVPAHVLLCGDDGEVDAPAPITAADTGEGAAGMHLDAAGLRALLREYPGATLVDVREACEHLAGAREGLLARAVNLPSSQLVNAIPAWLVRRDTSPIVFVCRSGRRSERAARCLRRLGYAAAFHVAGGLALEGEALRADT